VDTTERGNRGKRRPEDRMYDFRFYQACMGGANTTSFDTNLELLLGFNTDFGPVYGRYMHGI
jgi:hypothetical protein